MMGLAGTESLLLRQATCCTPLLMIGFILVISTFSCMVARRIDLNRRLDWILFCLVQFDWLGADGRSIMPFLRGYQYEFCYTSFVICYTK